MYIVNKHGIIMTIPDDWDMPNGARLASEAEVKCFEETGVQRVAKMELKPKKETKKEAETK